MEKSFSFLTQLLCGKEVNNEASHANGVHTGGLAAPLMAQLGFWLAAVLAV